MRSISVGIALAAAALCAAPCLAETVTYKASMNGAAEVPSNDTKATGTLTATYDSAQKLLSWKGSYSGLSGNATAAHFHGPADPGKNAGVAVKIPDPNPTFEGSATLTDAQAADLAAGRWYVNVHTAAHPGGEIRGQVTK